MFPLIAPLFPHYPFPLCVFLIFFSSLAFFFFFFNLHPHFSQLPIFWRSAVAVPGSPLPIICLAPPNCPPSDAQPPLCLPTLPGANVALLFSPGTSGPGRGTTGSSEPRLPWRSLRASATERARAPGGGGGDAHPHSQGCHTTSSCFPPNSFCIRRDLSLRARRREAPWGSRGPGAPRCLAASMERRS